MPMNASRSLSALILACVLGLSATTAGATVTSHADNLANPQGWSAVSGVDPRAVRELARNLPVSEDATGDQPWCSHNAQIEAALSHDFEEEKIATNARDTALWGSQMMGTWTMVLERPDQTSCIIASGIGFSEQASPDAYFVRVGLNS